MKIVAVILAAGQGVRFGAKVPKQFLPLCGKPLLLYSIEALAESSYTEKIVVAVHPEWVAYAKSLLKTLSIKTSISLIHGGETRTQSTLAAIRHLSDFPPETPVLIHDAARPLLSQSLIERVVQGLSTHQAVTPVLSVYDTLLQENAKHEVTNMPPRASFRRVQTPQGFVLQTLRKAHRLNTLSPHPNSTDDCSLVLHFLPQIPILTVLGEEENLKVTTNSDLEYLEFLLNKSIDSSSKN